MDEILLKGISNEPSARSSLCAGDPKVLGNRMKIMLFLQPLKILVFEGLVHAAMALLSFLIINRAELAISLLAGLLGHDLYKFIQEINVRRYSTSGEYGSGIHHS